MKTFGKYLEEKNKGLWDNIHAKRKRGEKMRKPGSKGAPTDADFKRSQEESVAEEQKLDEISQKKKDDYVAKASADRQSAWVKKGMADRTKDTKTSDAMKKKMAKRDKGMYRAMGEQNLDITEISLDMLTKKISNSGMDTTKKANKMDKTKDDLAALKARLAGKPALAKEATEVSELSKKTLGSYVKKAAGSAAGISAVATAQAMSSKGKSDPNDKRQLRNRLTGVSRATDKLTKEEVAEAKRKGAPKMTGDSFAMQRAKDAELNKALGRTKTGRKKPARQMTSTQRSLAQLRGESVQSADKKPEKYVKPDGKVGVRMVRVNKNIVDKDA